MYGLSMQLDVRRYPADASLEPSLPFVDWMARLRKATARPSATLLANHLRWQSASATGHESALASGASDCTHVGLFACPRAVRQFVSWLESERALLDRPKPAVPCSWCPAV
jgi:hypothetical protein